MSETALPPPPPPTPPSGSTVESGHQHDAGGLTGGSIGDPAGSDDSMMRNVGTEAFAMVVLMLAGPGLIVLSAGRVDTLAVALSFGAAMALAIGVIGAVANPALTLALLAVKEISNRDAVGDWIGQFVGGIVGGALIWGINDTTRSSVGSNGWDRGGLSELGSVIAAELVFTIVLVVVFLSAISQGQSKSGVAAFTGLAYAIGHLVLLSISGGGLNPARSLGSALFSDGDPHPLAQVVIFVIVPMIGAIAAVFVWLAIDDAVVDDTIFDGTIVDAIGDKIDGTVD